MCTIWADILAPKNFKPKTQICNFWRLNCIQKMRVKRWWNLPKVWFADGFVFSKFIPSCIDPTYCDTNPPEPSQENVEYTMPELGSLKYGDGEIINYKCRNPSKIGIIFMSEWKNHWIVVKHITNYYHF